MGETIVNCPCCSSSCSGCPCTATSLNATVTFTASCGDCSVDSGTYTGSVPQVTGCTYEVSGSDTIPPTGSGSFLQIVVSCQANGKWKVAVSFALCGGENLEADLTCDDGKPTGTVVVDIKKLDAADPDPCGTASVTLS